MIKERAASKTWTSRRRLAWALRLSTVLVPLAVALLAMVAASHLLPRPGHGLLVAGWYVLLLVVSYAASWATGKAMDRTLPLAALLEMSLTFPDSAPSRLGLSQRNGSSAELTRLATAPPDETTQDAAERILRLLTALSAHDRFTRGHAERVRAYTDLIAEKMNLPAAERERLRWAALLHDIGKLRVPSTLLNKAGQPSAAEWDLLKQHPIQGSEIAAPLLTWLRPMDRVIAEHHEKFDGSGYPGGLAGLAISEGSRIVTVADSFEAMTAVRSYSRPMKREAALAELVACAGTHFDPVVVRALLAVPHRRLQWAMGPTAWLAGLPMVGQGSLGALRTAVSHVGTSAIGATAVVVAAVAPSSIFGSTPTPAPSPRLESAAHAAVPAAAPTRVPAPTTSTAGSVPVPPRSAAPAPADPQHTPNPTTTTTRSLPKPHARPDQPATSTALPVRTTVPAVTTTVRPVTTTAAPTTTPVPKQTTPAPTHTATAPTTTPSPTRTKVAPTTTPAPAHPTTPAPATTPPTAPATTTTPPAVVAPAAAQCTASYASTGKPDKLQATITVRNSGTTTVTNGWTVTWSFASGEQQITSFTNANVSQSGKTVTATNDLLNGAGPPGAYTTFTIKGSGKAPVPEPTLTCTAR